MAHSYFGLHTPLLVIKPSSAPLLCVCVCERESAGSEVFCFNRSLFYSLRTTIDVCSIQLFSSYIHMILWNITGVENVECFVLSRCKSQPATMYMSGQYVRINSVKRCCSRSQVVMLHYYTLITPGSSQECQE